VLKQERGFNDRNKAFALLATGRTEAVAEILRGLRDIKLEGFSCFYESSEQVASEEFRRFTGYLTKNQNHYSSLIIDFRSGGLDGSADG